MAHRLLISISLIMPLVSLLCGCHPRYLGRTVEDDHYNPHRPKPEVSVSTYDRITSAPMPQTGAYYELMFAALQELDNPDDILKDLYTRGFEITHAWYRPAGACYGPSGDRSVGNPLPPFFIINMTVPDDGLTKWFPFREITRPENLPCPYYVREYIVSH